MPAYIVVNIRVNDPERYERYKTDAQESLARHGGRYLVRGGPVQVLEGDWQPSRFVLLEFDDARQARAWWESDDYAGARSLRRDIAETQMVLVEGIAPR